MKESESPFSSLMLILAIRCCSLTEKNSYGSIWHISSRPWATTLLTVAIRRLVQKFNLVSTTMDGSCECQRTLGQSNSF